MSVAVNGRLAIELQIQSQQVRAAVIVNERPLVASGLLRGKPVSQALIMVPLLFSLCGCAQACAAVMAAEAAMQITVDDEVWRRRQAVVQTEALREYVFRLTRNGGLGHAAGKMPTLKILLACLSQIQQQYDSRQQLFLPEPPLDLLDGAALQKLAKQARTLIGELLLEESLTRWQSFSGEEQLLAWSSGSGSLVARQIEWLLSRDWGGSGDVVVQNLPADNLAELAERIREEGYVAQPDWCGEPCETGIMARYSGPLVRSLRDYSGSGLLTRLGACVSEIERLTGLLAAPAVENITDLSQVRLTDGDGAAAVETARGRLVHRISVVDDGVADYHMLAPTEWNFHPQGVVQRALSSLSGEPDSVREQAEWFIASVDPCVGYELNVVEEGQYA